MLAEWPLVETALTVQPCSLDVEIIKAIGTLASIVCMAVLPNNLAGIAGWQFYQLATF